MLPAPEALPWGLHLEARLLSELNCKQPSYGAREPGSQGTWEPGAGDRHEQII